MEEWICATCGTAYPAAERPPDACPICLDERQYLPIGGQRWSTIGELGRSGHKNTFRQLEPGLWEIQTQPRVAIGQRALLVVTPEGNCLWDTISYLDEATVAIVKGLGGLRAIAVSHPHFYSSMARWADAFDAEIVISEEDRPWVQCETSRLRPFAGDAQDLFGGLRVLRLGGHFEGAAALHWPAGADGRGVLLTSDTVTVVADHRFVTFMRSYPNQIPLNARTVAHIGETLEDVTFDGLYGGWPGDRIDRDAKAAVRRSVERYIRAIEP